MEKENITTEERRLRTQNDVEPDFAETYDPDRMDPGEDWMIPLK